MTEADWSCVVREHEKLTHCQHQIGADQRGAEGRDDLGSVRRDIDMHDHADARRDGFADVARHVTQSAFSKSGGVVQNSDGLNVGSA